MTLVDADTGEIVARTLDENERIIAAGLQTFVEVGEALMEIRERRQYRDAGYSDFDAYCRQRWGMSRRRSSQLIGAAETVGDLGTTVPTPDNERQVRPLTRLPTPEAKRDAWTGAVDKAKAEGRDVPVARDVEDMVRKALGEELAAQEQRQADKAEQEQLREDIGAPKPGTPEAKEADRQLDVTATAFGWIRDFERRDMPTPAEVIDLADEHHRDVLRRGRAAHAWLSDLLARGEERFG